jgi:hypothetical protein
MIKLHLSELFQGPLPQRSGVNVIRPFGMFGFGRLFIFLILYTVGRIPWTGDQPVAIPLPTHRTTQTKIYVTLKCYATGPESWSQRNVRPGSFEQL